MSLLYSAVAKGRDVLVECNLSTKQVGSLAAFQLRNVRQAWGRHTVNSDGYNYYFLFQGEYAFVAIAEECLHRSVCAGFLNKVKEDFVQKYGEKPVTAQACKGFSSMMKQAMNHCNSHPEEYCKVAAVQKKVDEVKLVMENNINQVLERGEKLTVMVEKADDLRIQAKTFEKKSKEVKKDFWWALYRLPIVITLSLLVLAIVIGGSACFSDAKCRSHFVIRRNSSSSSTHGSSPAPTSLRQHTIPGGTASDDGSPLVITPDAPAKHTPTASG